MRQVNFQGIRADAGSAAGGCSWESQPTLVTELVRCEDSLELAAQLAVRRGRQALQFVVATISPPVPAVFAAPVVA